LFVVCSPECPKMSRGEPYLGHFLGEMGAPFGAWIAKEKPRIRRAKGSAAGWDRHECRSLPQFALRVLDGDWLVVRC
jgi:hypothetical protein